MFGGSVARERSSSGAPVTAGWRPNGGCGGWPENRPGRGGCWVAHRWLPGGRGSGPGLSAEPGGGRWRRAWQRREAAAGKEVALLGRWWLAGRAGAAPERHAGGRARSRSRRKVAGAGAEAGREPEEMQRPAGTGDEAGGGRRNSSGGRRPEAGLTGLTGLSVRYPAGRTA
ncbi:uncharacterized protein LOC131874152 [Cryptomeria japonica]|uniref:uncharacterized protein LOC131874152 n=1 Tax=Cryptomeria japonica TaxID=3369 RepID=UPI0027D9E2E0|nr:uncharacterized protein LOC131874152 [Cryptomeria japonica]